MGSAAIPVAAVSRPLHAGGIEIATVVASGAVPDGALELLAAGLDLAIAEASARRALAGEALEARRELSLLHRMARSIGSGLADASIGPSILAEGRRVLRSDAGVVRPTSAGTRGRAVPPAQLGPPDAVAALLQGAEALSASVEESGYPAVTAGDPAGPLSSVLAAPLRANGQVLGVVAFGRGPLRPPFGAGDQKLVLALAEYAAMAYDRAALRANDAARLRVEQELAVGRRIQRALLPEALPAPPGWELAAAYEPAREVGGDFFDVFPLRGRPASLGILIGDVTGKGIPAALLMAFARAIIRAAADNARGPADALERVNRILFTERRTSLFMSAFLGVLQLRTGTVTYASAGHEAPLLVSGQTGRSTRRLDAPGAVLGAFSRLDLAERRATLGRGDLLVAYTDGVTDARNAAGQRFGDARLSRAAAGARHRTAEHGARRILEAAHRFQGLESPADDLAILAIRRSPGPRRRPAAADARRRSALVDA